jgi:hypothetical protein
MKLYLFNSTREWDTTIARGIVANGREEAIKLFDYSGPPEDYIIQEHDITAGLCIIPFGYDSVSIEAELILA